MADQSTVASDLYIRGTLKADNWNPPNNTIFDQHVGAGQIEASKLQQQIAQRYIQDYGAIAATKRSIIHVAFGDGTLLQFQAGLVLPNVGAATVTVDLKKNGSTVLSSVVSLDNSNAAYASVLGTFAATAYSAGDVFEVIITATAGGGTLGQGLFVKFESRESSN